MKEQIMNYIAENLGLEASDAEDIFSCYLDTMDELCAKLKTETEAHNFQGMRPLTHSIIGCSGNIGATEISQASTVLNAAAKAFDSKACDEGFAVLSSLYQQLKSEK